MFELTTYKVPIRVQLDNGVYHFVGESATGKSYLANLLSKYGAYGEPVATYSYHDYVSGKSLTELLDNPSLRLVVVDRYDLYSDHYAAELTRKYTDKIVLVDVKKYNSLRGVPLCSLSLTSAGIEVF